MIICATVLIPKVTLTLRIVTPLNPATEIAAAPGGARTSTFSIICPSAVARSVSVCPFNTHEASILDSKVDASDMHDKIAIEAEVPHPVGVFSGIFLPSLVDSYETQEPSAWGIPRFVMSGYIIVGQCIRSVRNMSTHRIFSRKKCPSTMPL